MIKLQTFVTESIREIIAGIADAQECCGKTDARINPSGMNFRKGESDSLFWDEHSGRIAERVEFDIAVTATDEKGTKGGIGIFVGPIGLGSQGQSGKEVTSSSRIKFGTYVILPSGTKK